MTTHTEESSPELVEQIRDFIYDCTTDDCGHGWTLSAHQTDDLIAKVRASISSTPATTDDTLDMCAHGADRGSYCGYCGGYSAGAAK